MKNKKAKGYIACGLVIFLVFLGIYLFRLHGKNEEPQPPAAHANTKQPLAEKPTVSGPRQPVSSSPSPAPESSDTSSASHPSDMQSDNALAHKPFPADGPINPADFPVPDFEKMNRIINAAQVDKETRRRMRSEKDYPLTELTAKELEKLYTNLEKRRLSIWATQIRQKKLEQDLADARLAEDAAQIERLEMIIRKNKTFVTHTNAYVLKMEEKLRAAGLSR